ncbi:MAG: hypothetical protein B6I36_00190 [Desulfobacteraceae bacterium 4572_35.1]|nr:MAG: hypothetical protein B6I36_00190 [Desulfobacteraceae bacterium 4572_35.1]
MSLSVGREPNTMMKVVILTHNYRVVGRVYIKKGLRLTDMVCDARQFIAVAAAQVWERQSGNNLLQAGFINVSRDEIEIILPADEVDCSVDDIGSLGTWMVQQGQKCEDEQFHPQLDVDIDVD